MNSLALCQLHYGTCSMLHTNAQKERLVKLIKQNHGNILILICAQRWAYFNWVGMLYLYVCLSVCSKLFLDMYYLRNPDSMNSFPFSCFFCSKIISHRDFWFSLKCSLLLRRAFAISDSLVITITITFKFKNLYIRTASYFC